jgi:excisionase family DNA binding protein
MAKGKNVLTTGDVARICNVAPRTVSKWFDNGQLKGYRIPGSKDRRIPLNELIRFMKVHNMPTDDLVDGRVRILIVDSKKASKEALMDLLEGTGEYEAMAVTNNFQTGSAVQKFNPHVVVINLLAEDIHARAICESIRGDEELQGIKIIALTNHLSESESLALLHQGFDAHVSDMTDGREIIKKV